MRRSPDRNKTKDFYIQKGLPDGALGRLACGRGLGLRRTVLGLERLRDRVLGEITGKKFLEIGTGYGQELIEFTLRGARAVGVDFALTRLAEVPRRADEAGIKAIVVAGDCHALPFPDHTFDIVYGNAILAHLDRKRALAEVKRVLIPYGRLVLIEPLDRHPLLKLYRRMLTTRKDVVSYLAYEELDADQMEGGYELHPIGLTSAILLPLAAVGVDGVFWRGLARILGHLDELLFRRSLRARKSAWVCLALYHGRGRGR
ncbi:methyltransferase domain-containing protein [bacterium]|nr:methyltransferase domain-containing protein [bacterium]